MGFSSVAGLSFFGTEVCSFETEKLMVEKHLLLFFQSSSVECKHLCCTFYSSGQLHFEHNGTLPVFRLVIFEISLFRSLGQALPNLTAFAKAKAGAYKIFTMIDQQPTINVESPGAKELSSVQGRIEFRNVQFSYPSRPDVVIFRNFSLDIPASKTVAIVGGSGSGKSTVVSLIERFYDPNEGWIHDIYSWRVNYLVAYLQFPSLNYSVSFIEGNSRNEIIEWILTF